MKCPIPIHFIFPSAPAAKYEAAHKANRWRFSMLSFFSRRSARSSGSSSAAGQSDGSESSHTTKAISTALAPFGPHTSDFSSWEALMPVASQPAIRQAVVKQAVEKLFTDRHFSICQLDTILALVGAPQNTPAYKLLRALHCVNYGEMQPDVLASLPQLVNECLRPQVDVNRATETALSGVGF